MTDASTNTERGEPRLIVAPAPHLKSASLTTRRMMIDVLIALAPVLVASLVVFRGYAAKQVGVCLAGALAAEAVFNAMRRRPFSLGDCSAAVTGLILAFSLPGTAPWYVGVVGAFVGVGVGKVIFGGLGQNIFNPAMVGRAFVMIAFPTMLGASGYVDVGAKVAAITQATPMTAHKLPPYAVSPLMDLFLGNTNGSLGETSALACLLGGLYLCMRRTASWEIPLGALLAAGLWGGIENAAGPQSSWTVLHSLCGGALMFGAFFIATDPVTSPLTPTGKFIFGAGVGLLVMLIRRLSGWPEGVMFAVLLMNGLVPLINRWTIPRPVGGPVPVKKTEKT